jgi:hypothetical protein
MAYAIKHTLSLRIPFKNATEIRHIIYATVY